MLPCAKTLFSRLFLRVVQRGTRRCGLHAELKILKGSCPPTTVEDQSLAGINAVILSPFGLCVITIMRKWGLHCLSAFRVVPAVAPKSFLLCSRLYATIVVVVVQRGNHRQW